MATFVEDIRQRQLEAYEAAFNEYNVEELQGIGRIGGAIVRAAARAGWFKDLAAEDVDGMKPREVRKLMKAVDERHRELTALDPL